MKNKKGFTLIEVVVVMAIIAVLATLIIGAIRVARNTATDTVNRNNIKTIQTCLEAYNARYGAYCGKTAKTLCTNVDQYITNVAKQLTDDGITCNLSKTSTLSGYGFCNNSDPIGCSGAFYYLQANAYSIVLNNPDGTNSTSNESYPPGVPITDP